MKESITKLRKWNLIAGGSNPMNDVVPAGLCQWIEDALQDAYAKVEGLEARNKRLEEALEAMSKVIGPPGKSTWVSDDELHRAWALYILAKDSK